MNSFLTILLFLGLTLPLTAAETQITNVAPKAAAELVKENKVKVLDVRTDAEFAEGHLKGATNHDFTEDNFKTSLEKLDKAQPYLIHCESGARSAKSLKAFKELGFQHLYHLDGGIRAWKAEGLPVTK